MWGENSSGKKVSLLNHDTISPPTTISINNNKNTNNNKPVRPTLCDRSYDSGYSSSSSTRTTSSSFSAFSSSSSSSAAPASQCLLNDSDSKTNNSNYTHSSTHSSRSSSYHSDSSTSIKSSGLRLSRSPGHSPPTPPLTRLDSLSSNSTNSSSHRSPRMTSNYGFEPTDPTVAASNPKHSLPYYSSSSANLAKPYPHFSSSPQDATQQPTPYYHHLPPGQQPLPSLNPLDLTDPTLADAHTLQHLQNASNLTNRYAPTLSPTAPHPHQHQPTLINPINTTFLPTLTTLQQAPLTNTTLANIIPTLTRDHTHSSTQSSTSPTTATSPSHPSTSASTSASPPSSNPGPKKKYPCPHAVAFNCTDSFTTSGHAARHGKKHTGEKNVHCPTCGKAFTRKDNMKQHERTHKGTNAISTAAAPNHNPSRGTSGSASPATTKIAGIRGTRSRSSSHAANTSSGMNPMTPLTVTQNNLDAMDLDPQHPSSPQQQQNQPLVTPFSANSSIGGMNMLLSPTSRSERPRIQRSELSEILESVNSFPGAMAMPTDVGIMGVAGGLVGPGGQGLLVGATGLPIGEADAEGESPGLDALALAAGAVV